MKNNIYMCKECNVIFYDTNHSSVSFDLSANSMSYIRNKNKYNKCVDTYNFHLDNKYKCRLLKLSKMTKNKFDNLNIKDIETIEMLYLK